MMGVSTIRSMDNYEFKLTKCNQKLSTKNYITKQRSGNLQISFRLYTYTQFQIGKLL